MRLTEPEIGALIVAIARVGGLVATAPVIGDQGVSVRARLVAVMAIGGAIGANRAGVSYADLPVHIMLELAVGLLTGAVARFVMAKAAIAGQLVGLSLGLGFASQYDVHAGENAGTLRSIITTLASLAFLAVGGLDAIVKSCAVPAAPAQLLALGPALVQAGVASLGLGLSMAAPIVLAALVVNIGFAVMNRAAPSMNVFSIALPAVLVLGGIVLLSTSGSFITSIAVTARSASDSILGFSL